MIELDEIIILDPEDDEAEWEELARLHDLEDAPEYEEDY